MMDEREFEEKMRAALRPVEAPEGLAERIIRRAEARAVKTRKPVTQHLWLRWGALAALLVIGTFGVLRWEETRRAKQIEASRVAEQFTMAMTITTRKMARIQKNLVVEVPLKSGL